jgi:hypothetical protein
MKVNRLNEMSRLQQSIVLMVWTDVKEMPEYVGWHKYERSFIYEGKPYRYKCKFKVEEGHLRMINPHIEHEQVTIELIH